MTEVDRSTQQAVTNKEGKGIDTDAGATMNSPDSSIRMRHWVCLAL